LRKKLNFIYSRWIIITIAAVVATASVIILLLVVAMVVVFKRFENSLKFFTPGRKKGTRTIEMDLLGMDSSSLSGSKADAPLLTEVEIKRKLGEGKFQNFVFNSK
jgi:hypothetical protein